MDYTTVSQALTWIAPAFGLDAVRARPALILKIDYIRNILYGLFPEVPLAVDKQECVTLEEYPLECNDCERTFLGFTLPHDCEQVAGITRNEVHLALRTGWEEVRHSCYGDLVKYDILERVQTQHPHCPLGCPTRYGFFTKQPDDSGKKAYLTFTDAANQPREETLTLKAGEWVNTDNAVAELHKLTFDARKGPVMLRQEPGGNILSTYMAHEVAPHYRRVRIHGDMCCGTRLFVTYIRRRVPVTEDHDLVEVDSPVVWQALAHYARANDQLNPTAEERREAQVRLETARAFLMGQQQREMGADLPQMRFKTNPRLLRSGLWSKRR